MGLGKLKIPTNENTEPASTPPEGQATEPSAPKAPPPSGAEKASMFKSAYAYDDAVAAKEQEIEALKNQKSVAVKAILDACGKGPFHYRGKEIVIGSREGTYFFKDHGRSDVETIPE